MLILADDLGWRDVGCFGSTFHETPNIDRLAERGMRLTQAYAASPLCSPTRSSILTGQYPARIGITSPACHLPQAQLEKKLAADPPPAVKAVNADSLTRLKPEYFTLAEALREAGYATAHFGKWHLGHSGPYEPMDQGFDLDFPHTPSAPGPGGGYLAPWKFIKEPPLAGKAGEHIEDRMSQEAARFIRAHKDRPFYVNYWAYSVHSPWNARRDYIDHFKARVVESNPQHNPLYAAMIKSLDDGVGRLLDAVDEAGVADRTFIVFFSDNGGYAYPPKATDPEGYEETPATSNLPLRSGKASLYEGGTREPCILVWPGTIQPGSASDALFQSTDFYPTLLAACGIQPRGGLKLDGFNQMPLLLGRQSPRDLVFCHFPHGGPRQAATIPGFLPGAYVRRGDWKLIRFFADNDDGSDRFELFNLKEDIGESRNLAAEKPELVGELNELISGLLRDTEAVVPVRNPVYDPNAAKPDPLQGWKARSCEAAVKGGIVTVIGKGAAPFLGVAPGKVQGPAVVRLRARSAGGGEGKIEWLPAGAAGNPAEAKSVPFRLPGGDWQELRIAVPARGPLGIVRVYLPAQEEPVEIDWIELTADGKPRKWGFE
ncbi:MAG: sulfatase [Pirellulales bacterium]|nr:sulfatase [Pirellulales bacterium]